MQKIKNRREAAEQLADRLERFRGEKGVVLAIPRGGVPIGLVVAQRLGLPLDLAFTKKLGHPYNPEFAIGSVNLQSRMLNPNVQLPEEYLEEQTADIRAELRRRYHCFMGDRKPLELHGCLVIIVDDGVATGHTLLATIELVQQQQPLKVVVAVPVGPDSVIRRLEQLADHVECLLVPDDFQAVSQFYEEFEQVSDEEVVAMLQQVK